MSDIETTKKKIEEDFPALIEQVQAGEYIHTHSEKYGIVFNQYIYKLPMKTLEKNLLNVIAANEEYNKTAFGFNKKLGNDSGVVKKFFAIINEFKACIERRSFTDAFEQAMKLKLTLATSSEISHFTGDSDMGLAMNAISLKMTSGFFDALESMENEHKKLLSNKVLGELES